MSLCTYSDVTQSGFCSAGGFCGWHSHNLFNNQQYKFAFIGVPPNTCGCFGQSGASPNGNPGVDALISVMSHELTETATDPLFDGWWSSSTGNENGDECNFNFPACFTKTMANGAKYDITFGGHNYYIQANWDLGSNSCSMTPSTVATTASTTGPTTPNTTPSTAGNIFL